MKKIILREIFWLIFSAVLSLLISFLFMELVELSSTDRQMRSIEKIFSVKVKAVNTILIKGKVKRFKGILGKRSNTKKAIVTLAPGNTMDLSAGV